MPKHPDRPLLLSIIADKSVTLKGFATTDGPKTISCSGISLACTQLIEAGTLFRSAPHYHLVRYFSTEAAAKSFERANANTKLTRKKITAKPKVARISVQKPVEAKVVQPARIIWPAHIKPVCRMMPDRNAVSVTRQRIGTASWVTL